MNSVLVDSNVLIDIFTDSSDWYDWSRGRLTELAVNSRLYINPVIYSEISIGFKNIESLEVCMEVLPVSVQEIPKESLFLAGKAFLQYRKRGGLKQTTLPDFFIGAHAAVMGWQVISRDPRRMKYAYPGLEIISP